MKELGFFVVEGAKVPILLGNDVMEPLGANINMATHELMFQNLDETLPMIQTAGGHFVLSVDDFVKP